MRLAAVGLLLAVHSAAAADGAPQSQAADRPHLLFVIFDDWGLHAGAYGTKWIKTPGFDRVAREGLLFRNAYTPVAKCSPSRAILLTGRHAWQLEAAANHWPAFPAEYKVWPEVLVEQGWHVGFTGKGWGPGTALDAAGEPRRLTGMPFQQKTAPPPATGIGRNDYAANFAAFLDAVPAGAPWCFWYGAVEPHRPYEAGSGERLGGKSPADLDQVPGYWPDDPVVRTDILDYAYEVEHADRHLERMLAELERRALLDRTVVIVTSDHGMPFPRVKGYAYHDSNHVPLAIRWPAGIRAAGRTIDDFVDFTDLAPTILDLAGIDAARCGMKPITGRSWRPILESRQDGQVEPARDHVLLGKERNDVGRPMDQGYPIRGMVTREFLLLRNFEPSRWPAGNPETGYLDTDSSPTKTLILERGRRDRTDRFWAWNFGKRPGVELYRLPDDRDCLHNLADSVPLAAARAALEEKLAAELRRQNDPRILGHGEVFDAYPTANAAVRGYYERWRRGEAPAASWVNPSDVEPEPLDD
jgi:arylsulfatase A-like enzyme